MQRSPLTPELLEMVSLIARSGSFAAAARILGKVPSAVTYSIRQLEEQLDVLLFDRSSRQARLTPAGAELVQEGDRLLAELETVGQRIKRVATGWEPQLNIAVDSIKNTTHQLLKFSLRKLAGYQPLHIRSKSQLIYAISHNR